MKYGIRNAACLLLMLILLCGSLTAGAERSVWDLAGHYETPDGEISIDLSVEDEDAIEFSLTYYRIWGYETLYGWRVEDGVYSFGSYDDLPIEGTLTVYEEGSLILNTDEYVTDETIDDSYYENENGIILLNKLW